MKESYYTLKNTVLCLCLINVVGSIFSELYHNFENVTIQTYRFYNPSELKTCFYLQPRLLVGFQETRLYFVYKYRYLTNHIANIR